MARYSHSAILTAMLASCIAGVIHAFQPPSAPLFNQTFPANITNDIIKFTVAAPYFHNVSVGAAWVMPSSRFDLGARTFDCECFDPSQKCCMPATNDVAPFCVPLNATCCGNTFCTSGEICCGSSCCPSSTTCWLNPANKDAGVTGCCPKGQTCQGPSVCYDTGSKDCSNTLFPKAECCPVNLPYCRDLPPFGKGCYANSNASSVAATTSAVSPMLAPSACSDGKQSAKLGDNADSGCSGATKGTTTSATSIYTVVLSFISEKSGQYSLAGPALSAEPTGSSISTTVVFAFPSNVTTTAPPSPTTTATSSPKSTASTAPFTSSTSTNSALCFNAEEQHPDTCPTTSKPVASSTNNGGFPGASTVSKSRGNPVSPPFNLPTSGPGYYAIALTLFMLGLGLVWMERVWKNSSPRPKTTETNAAESHTSINVQAVEDRGLRLANARHGKIRVVKGSGQPRGDGDERAASAARTI